MTHSGEEQDDPGGEAFRVRFARRLAEVDAMLEAQHQRRDRPCSRCGAAIAGHVLVDYHDGVSWTNERICR